MLLSYMTGTLKHINLKRAQGRSNKFACPALLQATRCAVRFDPNQTIARPCMALMLLLLVNKNAAHSYIL